MDKVTGTARFASDSSQPDDLHAVLVLGDVTRGVLRRMDTTAARDADGVRTVITHADLRESVGAGTFLYEGGHFHTSFAPLSGTEIRYHGQLLALVVAESPEQARYAAGLVRWEVDELPFSATLAEADTADDEVIYSLAVPDEAQGTDSPAPDPRPGAPHAVAVDSGYTTASHLHQPIEPYAVRAAWDDEGLLVEVPSQWVVGEARGLAQALRLDPSRVRVVSRHVGGAFGGRILLLWHTVYVAEAARRLGQPVFLHVARPQMATLGSFRAATQHRVHLSADPKGRITGYQHRIRSQTSFSDVVPLPGTSLTARLYDIPVQRHLETVARCDIPTPGFMRAPLEYPAAFALESALDELAIELGTDPVELRLRNLHRGPAATAAGTVSLDRCLRLGAERFRWGERDPRAGAMRDQETGEILGWGMAVAHYPGYRGGLTECRLTAHPDGWFTVDLAAHDPGTGLASAVAVGVAETLGVQIGRVQVRLGDSSLPLAPMAAGSASTRTAVLAAQAAARRMAGRPWSGFPDAAPDGELSVDGVHIPDGFNASQITDARSGKFVQAEPQTDTEFRFSVGAHFVEVGVDPDLGRIRVRRMLGVFDVGTVMHPTALRNQLRAGMLWGVGHALMEDTVADDATGRFLANGMVDYHVLVHADVPSSDVVVLDDQGKDDGCSAKGAGELGVVGSSAAVTNAVHHATGHRVRDLPLSAQKVLDHVSDVLRPTPGPAPNP